MIRADHGRAAAVDTGTGSLVWTALDGRLRPYQQLLTDGDVVLFLTGPDGGPMTLHALLEDGRTRWTATGPADVVAFVALGGRLVTLQPAATVLVG